MAQNWYPFYVGDYARKTAHLTLEQHGAYRLLLDYYYSTGEPLPLDMKIIYRICRAHSRHERDSISTIIEQFFDKTSTGFESEKCSTVIDKQRKYIQTQSANAHARWDAKPMPARASTKTRTKTKGEVSPKYTPDFDSLWGVYPRRDGSKAEAFKIFTAIINSGETYGRIESGVRAYADSVRGEATKYIAHLTTFLNQRRWESDYTPATSIAEPSKTDRAREAIQRGVDKYEKLMSGL